MRRRGEGGGKSSKRPAPIGSKYSRPDPGLFCVVSVLILRFFFRNRTRYPVGKAERDSPLVSDKGGGKDMCGGGEGVGCVSPGAGCWSRYMARREGGGF